MSSDKSVQRDRPAHEARRAFEELDALRLAVEDRLAGAAASLACYADSVSGGFFHQLSSPLANPPANKPNRPGDPSKASSATCAAFLVGSGRWAQKGMPWAGKAERLAQILADDVWTSAELEEGNPFTVSFLLEALRDLQLARQQEAQSKVPIGRVPAKRRSRTAKARTQRKGPAPGSPIIESVDYWTDHLNKELINSKGGLWIDEFPDTAFLTYKATRALAAWERLSPDAEIAVREFGWRRLYEESVAVSAGAGDADVFELAYAALAVAATTSLLEMSPRERDALRHGIDQFFARQDDDGHWPRSHALFRYPKLGNAYCYEYELLVQMLGEPQLAQFLEDKRAPLTLAFDALEPSAIPIAQEGQQGWASGHLNRSVTAPESWTTASVYHFCHEFRRFVVDGIRKEVFAYARASLPASKSGRRMLRARPIQATISPDRFLDSDVTETLRLRKLLEAELLNPVLANADRVDRGHGLGRHVPNSAILYGPPGTSKTELAKIVAEILDWPLLKLDPSHLTRDGLDRLHAETNLLFTMLASSEQMVVLLDEFDELVQDRDLSKAESSSRFLTTAMLPKIAELADRRRIVYLLATNHIERFDDAISRAGRFDLVIPVMPPRLDEKLRHWPSVNATIERKYGPDGMEDDLRDILSDLTYLEFEQFASLVIPNMSQKALTKAIRDAGEKATLRKTLGDDSGKAVTWKSQVLAEARRNRLHHA